MQYQKAKQVASLVSQITKLEILSEKYSTSIIPSEVFNACKDLAMHDTNFRNDFYILINKLADKYKKIKYSNLENNY